MMIDLFVEYLIYKRVNKDNRSICLILFLVIFVVWINVIFILRLCYVVVSLLGSFLVWRVY